VALRGFLDLFRGKPHDAVGDGGQMSLTDHFRELRARLMRVVLVLIIGVILGFVFNDQLFNVLMHPYNDARDMLGHERVTKPVISGVGGPLMLQFKLAGVAALVVTCPYWLYQIWAFILPGLRENEKRWTRIFVGAAGPLFLAGVGVGYWIMPKGLQVLISFTPKSVENLVEFNDYFSFLTRMLLVFGVAFEIPLFVVLLNLAGVVKASSLARHRSWIVVGTFVFAAVATPSTDPFSMLMLAVPMTLLFFVSEIIARVVDRRRARAADNGWDDDSASPL